MHPKQVLEHPDKQVGMKNPLIIQRHDPKCVQAMVIISKLGLSLHFLQCLFLAWKMLLLHKALVFASDRLMGTKDIIIEVEVLSLIFSLAVDFSLETLMVCVGPYEIRPLIQEVYRENQM